MADIGWRRASSFGGAGDSLARLGDLIAVTSVGFAAPILESFGHSPETFIARGAAPWDVLAFGLVVFVGPPLLLFAVEILCRALLHVTLRDHVHGVLVAVGGGIAAAHWLRHAGPVPAIALLAIVVIVATVLALARALFPNVRAFVRLVGVASVW